MLIAKLELITPFLIFLSFIINSDASVFLRTHRDCQHGQAVSQAEEGIQRNKLRYYDDRRYRTCRCFDGWYYILDAVRCEKRHLPK